MPIAALCVLGMLILASPARSEGTPDSASPQLESYIVRVARAWEPYTNSDGRVVDPLRPADTSDNYGVVMLADVMLKMARRRADSGLEAAGMRILNAVATLTAPSDPFNMLALAAVIRDGQRGELPSAVWERLDVPLTEMAGQIGETAGNNCLTEPGCYSNWHLVWSAGASLLAEEGIAGQPGSLVNEIPLLKAQIADDLTLALEHSGAPLLTSPDAGVLGGAEAAGKTTRQSGPQHRSPRRPQAQRLSMLSDEGLGGRARELSDPGAEPSAYELFSAFMLEVVGEADPAAITPQVARLRRQADRYALDMMAPDGQLSLSGRSLDQSWVQAAAAALGARRAASEPASALPWRSFSEEAFSYLQSAYPLLGSGLLPIVPGLDLDWSPSIMDHYAAFNQYEGLTLWLLSDALERWPSTPAPRMPLPSTTNNLLDDDLATSGLVWGHSGKVWWQLSGRSTSGDPRSAQGVVDVKVHEGTRWNDLLALRPIRRDGSSVWTLERAGGLSATPRFLTVEGAGNDAVLSGTYTRPDGHVIARAIWTLKTTSRGVKLSMSMPRGEHLRTTLWLSTGDPQLRAPGAKVTVGTCVVSASGRACPVSLEWRPRRTAMLEISSSSAAVAP